MDDQAHQPVRCLVPATPTPPSWAPRPGAAACAVAGNATPARGSQLTREVARDGGQQAARKSLLVGQSCMRGRPLSAADTHTACQPVTAAAPLLADVSAVSGGLLDSWRV
eukprot:CAMPEP_0174725372 /NCGR_PEP_ID=MMETSP1094-20130205/45401_1 /TAXON_ID=156173 /ORGANISM="Chrysochromulina brevifilum, Strain UTEX LB 985" /LENGTH=109 /DNA_ID=CAMNT_0015926759 /DNA_START=69 /DNA_END=398 /DNA_ORIENTATION=-